MINSVNLLNWEINKLFHEFQLRCVKLSEIWNFLNSTENVKDNSASLDAYRIRAQQVLLHKQSVLSKSYYLCSASLIGDRICSGSSLFAQQGQTLKMRQASSFD